MGKEEFDVTQILLCLLLGIAIGALRLIPTRLHRFVNGVSTLSLLVMLTALGAKLGAQPSILDRIALLGIKALILALAAIAGAVLFVYVWQRLANLLQKHEETPTEEIPL